MSGLNSNAPDGSIFNAIQQNDSNVPYSAYFLVIGNGCYVPEAEVNL
jgi:hypothetical protein